MSYDKNLLLDFKFVIDLPTAISDRFEEQLRSNMKNISCIYSYMILAHSTKGDANSSWWEVRYNISDNELFNTITTDEFVQEVATIINKDIATIEIQRVIGFRQPPLECMLKLYQPLIHKIARIQCERWRGLEFDDVCQIASLCMCVLYQKNYYIHKALLVKTVNNAILHSLRKDRLKPPTVLLSDPLPDTYAVTGEALTYADIIEDPTALDNMYKTENLEADKELLEKRKRAVISYLGERTYQMLYNEYTNKSTSPYGRMIMEKVKQHFKKRR